MAGGDLLGISSSGVVASQRALGTTGHNIANANTPGYSRQRIEMESRQPQFSGNGSIGTGVIVDNVSRVYDEFLVSELRDTTSLSKFLDSSYHYTSQVDDILADPEASLSPSISEFFKAVNGVANDPASNSSRQVLLSSAKNLSDRFEYLNTRFESLRNGTGKDMRAIAGEINKMADAIAELNEAIVRSREITNKPANDLLDQRDRLVQQLSEKINVRTTIQDDGRMNVFVGNGQTLVVGDVASHIDVVPNEHDPTKTEIVFKGVNSDTVITQFLTGGQLGGIRQFIEEVLDPAQNELGRIATGIAKSFNEQHRLGMDLKNRLGTDFFTSVHQDAPTVLQSKFNKGDIQLDAEITDVQKLTTSDYQLSYLQGQYELLRLEDDKVVARFNSFPHEVETDGLKLTIKSGSTVEQNDRFLIQPTRRAADLFQVRINSIAEIAASSPIRVEADIDNLGDADIDVVQVTDTTAAFDAQQPQLQPPYVVKFVDNKNFVLLDNTGKQVKVKTAAIADDPDIALDDRKGAIPAIPASETGDRAIPAQPPVHERKDKLKKADGLATVEGPIPYDPKTGVRVLPSPGGLDRGMHIRVSGEPKAGDVFRIEFNKYGTSDNSNALSLANLQTEMVLMDGKSDFAQTYGQLVSRVGAKTNELSINQKAQNLLLKSAQESREEMSGVNLDEEAAQLIRYQNLYQANAQVLATAKQTFQLLMDAFRR